MMSKEVSLILCIHHLCVGLCDKHKPTGDHTVWCLNFLGHGADGCCHSLDGCFCFTSYEHAHVLCKAMILGRNMSPFGYSWRWIWAVFRCLHIYVMDRECGTYCAAVFLIPSSLWGHQCLYVWQVLGMMSTCFLPSVHVGKQCAMLIYCCFKGLSFRLSMEACATEQYGKASSAHSW
jgi:hypothetical protein